MKFFDDIQAKADVNDDGKINAADLEALKAKYPQFQNKLDELKAKADTNGDGKVSLEDVKHSFGEIKNDADDGADDLGRHTENLKDDVVAGAKDIKDSVASGAKDLKDKLFS